MLRKMKVIFYVVHIALLICLGATASAQNTQTFADGFSLTIHSSDSVDAKAYAALNLKTNFKTLPETLAYLTNMPQTLALKGFPIASVDSFWVVEKSVHASIYLGQQYNPWKIDLADVNPQLLQKILPSKPTASKTFTSAEIQQLQSKLLSFYENNGYPFAKIYLNSIQIQDAGISAKLKIDSGLLYRIDSTRIYGKANINKKFLQRHLSMPNGSIYSSKKLAQVDGKLSQLPFYTAMQPSDITMLGNGALLNVYLEEKKSSQVNFLVGFLPSANQTGKLQVTGDVNLDLKNLLGSGENILLKWQQLQPKSPRLNLGYDQSYIFNSPFGFNFLFDLFKKDSNFIQINALAGVKFALADNQSGKLFIQVQNSSLLQGAVDTNSIKQQRALPVNIDISAFNTGLQYNWQTLNYLFNPRSGSDVTLEAAVGMKNIKRNNEVLSIKEPGFNYSGLYDSLKLKSYQLRLKLNSAHYFKVGKAATIKTALNAGWYNSPEIFRNDLFQIGGNKLLRGFDEESIYATTYGVATAEYRYLVGRNAYLFTFADFGYANNKFQSTNFSNHFISTGLGIFFETKAGLLNLSFAAGKRNDARLNLREAAKIHFGYINYF